MFKVPPPLAAPLPLPHQPYPVMPGAVANTASLPGVSLPGVTPLQTLQTLPNRQAYNDRDAQRLAEDPAFDRLATQVRAQVVETLAKHSAYRKPIVKADGDNADNIAFTATDLGKPEFRTSAKFPGTSPAIPSDVAKPHDNFTLILPTQPAQLFSPPQRSYLPPLLRRALNAIVLDYLQACNYGYSLSVFAAESGERAVLERMSRDGDRNAGMGRTDILRCLGVYLSEEERRRGGILAKVSEKVVLLEQEERAGWRDRDQEWLQYMKGRRGGAGGAVLRVKHSAFGEQVNKMNAALKEGRDDVSFADKYPHGHAMDTLEAQSRDLQREVELEYDSEDEIVSRPEESLLGVFISGLTSLPLPKHFSEAAVDTRGIGDYSNGDSLEWKLRQIEEKGASRKLEETDRKSRSVEERVQAYMREERERCEREINERVEILKRTLVNQVRAEEREKYSADMRDYKRQLNEERERWMQESKEREMKLREEMERRDRERESSMFRQRQECMSALEGARRREEEAMNEKKKHEYNIRQADIQLSQERAALNLLRGEVEGERRRLEELIDTAKRKALHENEAALREERGLRTRIEAELGHVRGLLDDAEQAKNALREQLHATQVDRDALNAKVRELDAIVSARDKQITSLETRLQPLLAQMEREVEMRARVIAAEGDAANRRELFELQGRHKIELEGIQRNKDAEMAALRLRMEEEARRARESEEELRKKVKVLNLQLVELMNELEAAHAQVGQSSGDTETQGLNTGEGYIAPRVENVSSGRDSKVAPVRGCSPAVAAAAVLSYPRQENVSDRPIYSIVAPNAPEKPESSGNPDAYPIYSPAPTSPKTKAAKSYELSSNSPVVAQLTSSAPPQTPQHSNNSGISDSPDFLRIPKARAMPVIPDSPPESDHILQLNQQAKYVNTLIYSCIADSQHYV